MEGKHSMKKVLLISWDAYPHYATGGVYTWTKAMIDSMQDFEFIVLNVLSNPNSNRKFTIPSNVTKIIQVPIYGCNRFEEFCKKSGHLIPRIIRTTESVVRNKFLPLYEEFLSTVLSERCEPKHLADLIIAIHRFFIEYDSKKCLEHHLMWEVFTSQLLKEPIYSHMTLNESLSAFQVIQKNIQLLSVEVPKVDIIHCALAWLPSLIAIYVKQESDCPLIITEHGVAFRELSFNNNVNLYGEPPKIFWNVFSYNIIKTLYWVSDAMRTVAIVNKVWEEDMGVEPSKIKVIYNGVNTAKFRPLEIKRDDNIGHPTLVCLSRLEIYKDIQCLIRAIKYVKEQIPDIKCLIYGTSGSLKYAKSCVKVLKELQLEDTVKFMGGTKEPEKAFNAADIVVLTGITEGFPFTVVEAMACGKAVIAADVGGVSEALKGCGLLVRSLHPPALAKGIIALLKDENLRHEFERAALQKIRNEFTLENTANRFRKEYTDLLNLYEKKKQGLINSFEDLEKTSTITEELEKEIKGREEILEKDQREIILTEKINEEVVRQPEKTLNEYLAIYNESPKKLIKEQQDTMTQFAVNQDDTKTADVIMEMHHILQPAEKNRKEEVRENSRSTEIKKEDHSMELPFSSEKLKEYSDEELSKYYMQLLYKQDDQSRHIVLAIHAELRERYEVKIKKEESLREKTRQSELTKEMVVQ